eukprot:TRINITY_DN13918_c1_g2_i2.p1 TRINITY_DN13918_c1_g2~~TRINITY_DN13918_c1_g2_i2.p1  ORF type:complete len:622 (+),score=102.44 TRINITY_DN13918_c1_g2_i2:262-2127(+)
MSFDYGWRGLGGFFAIVLEVCVISVWIKSLDLTTWVAWTTVYASEVIALIFLLLLALMVAKILATAIHMCVTCWKISQYRKLAETAVLHQEQDYGHNGVVRKVLICHASVGAGHKRAAEALAASIHRLDVSVDVKVVDLMQRPYADRTLIYFYKDWYLRLVGGETFFGSLGGLCVGFFFDRANKVQDSFTGGGTLQRRITQSLTLNFLQLVCDMKPDVVIHTHFLAPEILAGLRRRHGLKVPHVTVVTDMDVHAWWYQQPTDHYFVPRDMAKHQLETDGVPSEDITVSGIPIMPQFQDTLNAIAALDINARRRRFLKQMDSVLDAHLFDGTHGQPIVIQMSTGKSVIHIYEKILLLETPIILIVVCGRQADVRSDLEAIKVPERHRVALIGNTACIYELLAVSDVLITKPGGLITSEALACGLMMVIVDPYPGQEERNAAMLLEEGVGIWIWDYRDIQPKLDTVLRKHPDAHSSLAYYQRNSRRLAKPDAAFAVARYVLSNAPWDRMNKDIRCCESSESGEEDAMSSFQVPLYYYGNAASSIRSKRPTDKASRIHTSSFLGNLGLLQQEASVDVASRGISTIRPLRMQDLDTMQANDRQATPPLDDCSDNNEETSEENFLI